MHREFVARPFAHTLLGAILLVALGVLAGCGGSSQPEAEPLPTATLVATWPAPTATPVPVEPTATSEPVVDEANAAAAPSETVTESEEVTATEEITTAQEITATAQISAGEETGATEQVTATEALTTTADVTVTEEVTTTEEVTITEEVTATEQVTATGVITASEEVTATEEVSTTEEVTASEEVTATGAVMHGHAHPESAELTPSSALTGSSEITSTTEITDATTSAAARLFFLQPTTNAIVPLTFTVVISYSGVTLASETDHAAKQPSDTGHIHLLIDSDFIETGETIPVDDLHHHFADGSTSVELSLSPGSHILRLQFAGSDHVALAGGHYRQEIAVNVVDGAPEQAVRIASPTTGAIVPPSFNVVMAASGISVEPAGVVNEGAGHFHLLIDEPFVPAGEIIPTNETHLHFGQAQLSTQLTLEPGDYLLRLQLADGTHRALRGNQYRAEVSIRVEEDALAEQVRFIKPADGATVTSPFLVGWAAHGLIIESAGHSIRPNAGHLHLLVNEEFVEAGEVIPADETHLHFGQGQTSTLLTLEPGEYTLRLQMADGGHIAHDGAHYQDKITVTVK